MSDLKIIEDLKCLGSFEFDIGAGKIKFYDAEGWGSDWLNYEQIGLWIDDLHRLRQAICPVNTYPDIHGEGPDYPY